MDVTVQHLQATGIGRTVNALRKDDGEVGIAAKALIFKWKQMVAAESSGCSDDEKNDEDPCDNDDENVKTNHLSSKEYSQAKYPDYVDGRSEQKPHKSLEHVPTGGSSSSSNNYKQESRSSSKSNENHHKDSSSHRSSKRMYSSDTQEQIVNKHRSHTNDDEKASKRKEKEIERNGRSTDDRDYHKISSSKHSKSERHHTHSMVDIQLEHDSTHRKHKSSKEHNQNKFSDQKLDSIDSRHHSSSSSSNIDKVHHHSSSKHKRYRDGEHSIPEKSHDRSKRQKCDTTTSSSSRSEEKKSSKSKPKTVDDGIEIDHSMGTSFADALGQNK